VGGVENAVISLARGLAALRSPTGQAEFRVTVVTLTDAGHFDDRTLPFRVFRKLSFLKLINLIRQADVVHVAGPSLTPLLLAYSTRTPLVVEHHGYQAVCLNGLLLQQPGASTCPGYFQERQYSKCVRCFAAETSLLRGIPKLLTMFPRQFVTRRADVNIAITRHVMDRQRLPHTQVVYYGIEDPLKGSIPGPPKAVQDTICFAYVGRFVGEKGLPVLLQAASLLHRQGISFRVLLVGDGQQRPELEEIIRREQLQEVVCITGYLRGEQLAAALQQIDVVVMPSLWEETAGLSAIEQMMCGKLVIASAIGGLREIVADGGLTFPPGDAVALAQHMRAVITEPSSFDNLRRVARSRSLRMFQLQTMINEHAAIYKRLSRSQLQEFAEHQ